LLRMAAKTGVEPLEVVSAGTIKEDYDYWIRPNLGSLARKVLRLERRDPPPPTEVNTPEELRALIDNAPRASMPGPIGRRFTCNLLFVGRKRNESH